MLSIAAGGLDLGGCFGKSMTLIDVAQAFYQNVTEFVY
jgi:hypothetical protein